MPTPPEAQSAPECPPALPQRYAFPHGLGTRVGLALAVILAAAQCAYTHRTLRQLELTNDALVAAPWHYFWAMVAMTVVLALFVVAYLAFRAFVRLELTSEGLTLFRPHPLPSKRNTHLLWGEISRASLLPRGNGYVLLIRASQDLRLPLQQARRLDATTTAWNGELAHHPLVSILRQQLGERFKLPLDP